jgi:predicted Zn-ribbon and HTH transcriptional regulator
MNKFKSFEQKSSFRPIYQTISDWDILIIGAVMKEKPKEPVTPIATHDTSRHAIIAELLQGPCSARDLSAAVSISEREVSVHLEHIRKSLVAAKRHLVVLPAACKKCGFVFAKREKLKRPGKCPVCKGESIQEPLFLIEEGK